MDSREFRKYAHSFADWMADYYESVEKLPVRSNSKPGDIYSQLPVEPPKGPESMEDIFKDFREKIIPGMTHWQSPNFFAYFPANTSYPSILAEMLTSAMGAQCMVWESSPAAAELEEKVMDWLKHMTGIPAGFSGVIQDTASTATLTAILTARERASKQEVNRRGFGGSENYRVYCSTETHSSVEKAVKIAGIGSENLVKLGVDRDLRMDSLMLEQAVKNDIDRGYYPLCVVATLGTTGTTSIDPLDKIASITARYGIWLHVDAAMAGSALLLPEYRWMINGIEDVDSLVFNPHKWLFTNFDCSAYFVRDREMLTRSFEILPEYLKTDSRGKVNDYRDWGIQLGRRFRALKLWFVIRNFGVSGLQKKLRFHLELAGKIKQKIETSREFRIMAPVTINTICFRYEPENVSGEELDSINETLMRSINDSGKAYFTHTRINGVYVIRMVIGQTNVEERHVMHAWELIEETAKTI